jgi:hypothetical protein
MTLANTPDAAAQVRATALLKLNELKSWLATQSGADEGWHAAYFYSGEEIRRFITDPKQFDIPKPVALPEGMPIGADDDVDGDWN